MNVRLSILALLIASLVVVVVIGYSRGGKEGEDYRVLAARDIKCPEGAHVEFLPWGESGLRATCLQQHGPIAIAEGGHVAIEGQYRFGKKVGEWRWLDANGKVVRVEQHGD